MLGKSLRLAACGAIAAGALTAVAVPANAASTEGRTTTVFDQCVTEELSGVTFCRAGTERRIEVHTPSGVVVLQGTGDYSDTTSYPGGSYASEGTHRYVSVFASSAQTPDGVIYFDPNVIKIDSESTLTYSDGMTCVFDMDYAEANNGGGYNHSTGYCTMP
jgi:hypothetical protein